jgi:hypothetical protein
MGRGAVVCDHKLLFSMFFSWASVFLLGLFIGGEFL